MLTALDVTRQRKLRLLGCGVFRRLQESLFAPDWRQAITASEQFSDGQLSRQEFDRALARIRAQVEGFGSGPEGSAEESASMQITRGIAAVANHPLDVDDITGAIFFARQAEEAWAPRTPPHGTQADLFRCIFGNPFRPTAFDITWCTGTVIALAEGIYAERAFDRLPILADALQDAGCDSDELLNHLRGKGPHVRGCWALDLVLGKS
ncbi:hypothetical protein R5W24_003831 [Gemmata sp. JC717]|uniref:hypothetical protein n=1 Tax=Gemmata algarum TaxID=2975278 RepID=UPI0021BAAF2A|nr:hypothetical protein [Gemmata algarum]MDY3554702.1 hypothetical protein [Gemmata algarum]